MARANTESWLCNTLVSGHACAQSMSSYRPSLLSAFPFVEMFGVLSSTSFVFCATLKRLLLCLNSRRSSAITCTSSMLASLTAVSSRKACLFWPSLTTMLFSSGRDETAVNSSISAHANSHLAYLSRSWKRSRWSSAQQRRLLKNPHLKAIILATPLSGAPTAPVSPRAFELRSRHLLSVKTLGYWRTL